MDAVTSDPAAARAAPTPAEASADRARTRAEADFDSFLTLLTAQLRNQDPMQPMESTEFVAQLAAFSTVEQLVGTNERLDALSVRAEGLGAPAGWIGRDAAHADGRLIAGRPVRLDVPDREGTGRVEAILTDDTGTERGRLDLTPGETATLDAETLGDAVAPGTPLTARLVWYAGEEVAAEAPARVYAPVQGVRADADGVVIERADGLEMRAEDVVALSAAPS